MILNFPLSVSSEPGGPLADECAVFVQQMVLGPTLKTLLQLFYCSSWHQQGGTPARSGGEGTRPLHSQQPCQGTEERVNGGAEDAGAGV